MPREVPAGRVVLAFTPEGETHTAGSRDTPEYLRRKAMEEHDLEIINRNAGRFNREMEDTIKYQVDIFEHIPPYES